MLPSDGNKTASFTDVSRDFAFYTLILNRTDTIGDRRSSKKAFDDAYSIDYVIKYNSGFLQISEL